MNPLGSVSLGYLESTLLSLLTEKIKKTLYINTFFLYLIGSLSNDTADKLEKHLKLLKEEYSKLQRGYAELERKYNKAVASADEKVSI